MVLFISGGEIAIVLLFILIFFGADKIPEFARFMGKGVREFQKATDDIKREFQENSSGMMNNIKSIGNDLTNSLTKEIAEPVQQTANEASKSFDEYQEQFDVDYYYDNKDDIGSYGNEYQKEVSESAVEPQIQKSEESQDLKPETEV